MYVYVPFIHMSSKTDLCIWIGIYWVLLVMVFPLENIYSTHLILNTNETPLAIKMKLVIEYQVLFYACPTHSNDTTLSI